MTNREWMAAAIVACLPAIDAVGADEAVVQLKDDPCRRVVLENEKVRVWEVNVPIGGGSCPFHEHRIDMVSVRINATEITNVPKGGWFSFASDWHVAAGSMQYSEYDNSPYVHRISPKGPNAHRVVEFELLARTGEDVPRAPRPGFSNVFDKPRAIASRIVLEPSQSIDVTTPKDSLIVVVRGGSASPSDLKTADVKWISEPSRRSVRNDGKDSIEWVEIEVK